MLFLGGCLSTKDPDCKLSFKKQKISEEKEKRT
jgi:hypothetical protein